jgi:2-keto-4-pentenoate hydratase
LFEALSIDLTAPSVECEIAVVIGADIDGTNPKLSPFDIVNAIATCHLACEIVDNRYGDPQAVGTPTLLGDDFFHAGFVLGRNNPDWRALDMTHLDAKETIDGEVFTGNSSQVLSAIDSLTWLVRKLAQNGRRLRPGEIVLTGTIIPPTPVKPPPRELILELQGFEPLRLHGN